MASEVNRSHELAETGESAVVMEPVVANPDDSEIDASLNDLTEEQNREAELFAMTFMKKVLRLRGVKIDRAQFLKSELHKRGYSPDVIATAITGNPAQAGISIDVLDSISQNAIDFETRKSSSLSFMAGLPGGLAMLGTIPADITQFYVHAFRVMQKIAYVYGWQDFLKETDDIDDESLGILATFLGVMMGVGGASASLNSFATKIAAPAVERNIARVALTKTIWYGPMKKTLRIIGINITKQSFAKSVSKVVPVVGGVISGGMTFVVLGSQSQRLQKHLRTLPPPNVDAGEYLRALTDLDAQLRDARTSVSDTLASAGSSIKGAATGAVDYFRPVDLDGDGLADEARVKTTAKKVFSAAKSTVIRNAEVPAESPDGEAEEGAPNRTGASSRKILGMADSAQKKLKSKFKSKRSSPAAAIEAGAGTLDDSESPLSESRSDSN
ncbi:hypothetical protein SLW73_06950 [Glutamicibacter protophormiae]|uniref:hypothetical protein n=1 Tax=Glutamicibacter protophormiae TaxID=37930 RepID=UPI002A7F24C9|nr:hypothetical protein [Glutamicibacter protophormiae]WPR66052.1 hypothetical protein SLW72_06955 [Glutamicibacter protophormiae]WPR69549.1 hypothetical protein SLW73_06950 [Glutamicibacter protophormiae]